VRLTFGTVMLFGLTIAFFQDPPAQGQTEVGPVFQVVPTPNENLNSELFAASASSPNDIWAVGQSTIHFDGTTWTAFPAPMIKGDNNSFLQGVVAISPTLAWAAGNVSEGAHPGQVIEQWNGTKWSLFAGPRFGKKEQANVFAMTSSSANDVWAIGSLVNLSTQSISPLFEHWNGTAWSATTGESDNEFLFGASADATNDAWAVGFNGSDNIETSAMHWDGTNWTSVATPNVGEGTNKLNAVPDIVGRIRRQSEQTVRLIRAIRSNIRTRYCLGVAVGTVHHGVYKGEWRKREGQAPSASLVVSSRVSSRGSRVRSYLGDLRG
jgi:hypothetical protein